MIKKSILLTFIATMCTSGYTLCSQPDSQNNEQFQEQINNARLQQEFEKLQELQRNNSLQSRALANIGDHATAAFFKGLSDSFSGSVVELVRRELDIIYDNRPITAAQLNEIQAGLGIINSGITLTGELAKQEGTFADTKEEKDAINARTRQQLKELQDLREEHIKQFRAIRDNRKPLYSK